MLGKCSFHAVRTILASTIDGLSLNFRGLACIVFAFSVLAFVWIGFFGHDVVFLEVVHSIGFFTTVATFIDTLLLITVDNLLLRECQ